MSPQTSFLICCLPRSGSWLLAEGLQQTAVAGNPREFFAPELETSWRQDWGLPVEAAYSDFVAKAIEAGSTSNDVFGAKIHWYQFEFLEARLRETVGVKDINRGELFERFFPHLRLIWLQRRDKVRQAVSYYKASRTEQWWDISNAAVSRDASSGGDDVEFDFAGIAQLRHTLMTHEGAWARFFTESSIRPLVVEYEGLAQDYDSGLRSVLDYLGINGSAIALAPTRLRKQADAVSEHWVRRFREIERQQLGLQGSVAAATTSTSVGLGVARRGWAGEDGSALHQT